MGQLECAGLLCQRGDFVLQVHSLAIGRGEKIALLGENGCGKTTLLQALAGLLPMAGAIHYQGQRWDRMTAQQRAGHMSYLPQEADVLFNISVQELLRLSLSDAHILDDQGRAQAIEATEVADLQQRCFHSLSGGERRRAMLARILCRSSAFLFLDEPTAPLDLRHAVLFMRHICRLEQAVVVAMHDLNLAMRYFDRFLLMKNGRIIFDKYKDEISASDLEQVYGIKLNNCAGVFMPDT